MGSNPTLSASFPYFKVFQQSAFSGMVRIAAANGSSLLHLPSTQHHNNKMSAEQNHHYLPQSYQRGWANSKKQVYVYQWHHNKLVCATKSTKSTGSVPGLYFSPMAPSGKQNAMEDEFWRAIDQWGANGLALLRSTATDAPTQVNKEKLAVFIMSLLWRNPKEIGRIEAEAKLHVTTGELMKNYTAHRRLHEPDTFEEFQAMLDKPGISEFGVQILRSFVLNAPIRNQLLHMNWQVVTVANGVPILTSDVPLIRYRGLKDDDGLLILPLSSTEFFVAFNNASINMQAEINQAILSGKFVEGMNRYIIQHKLKYVYAIDETQSDFVARHWNVS